MRSAAVRAVAVSLLFCCAGAESATAKDRTPVRAGQNVNFYSSGARCTTAFVVSIRGVRAALTAGHCSRYPARVGGRFTYERVWRVRGRGSAPMTNLGVTMVNSVAGGPDALAFSLQGAPRAQQRVQRRGKPSVRVAGWVRLARQRKGMRVCFTGRATGTRCGRLSGVRKRSGSRRLVCASMRVRTGDSGGPVYTRPRAGRAKAVGLVKAARPRGRGMCFTPIGSALNALQARLR